MRVIGLTGGIGSGKSTVARFMAELGAVVMELDSVGHEAMKPGTPAYRRLVNEFGKKILAPGGEIDRVKLGDIVFSDPGALQSLNDILHPEIDKIIEKRLEEYRSQGIKVVVLEAAARLDSDRASQVDEVWITTAPEDVVLERLLKTRGHTEKEIRARIASQPPVRERIRRADVVINNDGSLDELAERVKEEWEKLMGRGGG